MRNAEAKIFAAVVLAFSLSGCDALDKRAADEYEAATRLWTAGEYQMSVNKYFELAKDHPLSSRADNALYWGGVTQFLYLGETEKALQTLRLVLKKYPRRDMAPAAQFYIAQIYELGYNDYERAIQEYRKAAAYSDRDIREKGMYSLADNLFRTGKIDEAKETWIRQAGEFPSGSLSAMTYFRLGTTAFSKGRLEEAEAYYRKALENNRDVELVLKTKFALAGCLEANENVNEALKLFKEIAPAYPNREAIDIKIKALEVRIFKKSY